MMASTNEWYKFYIRTGGNTHIIPRGDPFIKEIIRRENIIQGRPVGTPVSDGKIRHWVYRFDEERNRWGSTFEDVMPLPIPGSTNPVKLGDWSSHFLATSKFFGPAIAARSTQEQNRYFQKLIDKGYKTVMINAEQADWGPLKGHPEWTAGGYNVFGNDTMQHLKKVINRARVWGLQVMLGVIDQPSLKVLSLTEVFRRSQHLVDNTHEDVCLYMGSWEINEVWINGGIREPNILEWVKQVDWKNRDFGIHYSPSLQGGISFYNSLNREYNGHIVRMMQYFVGAPDSELREWTDVLPDGNPGVARVAVRTGTKYCNFEHSSELNQFPLHDEASVIRRRGVIMEAAANAGLPSNRIGFMN